MSYEQNPDEWIRKYVSDWYFWNGIAFCTVGILGIIMCIVILFTK